ncbi:MAG TPA: cupredoxin domain-containing protein [Terriglobales bacterium]|jgi:cytochrome c oxidase subunit 2|nr:cupredoxin domain-containing protein [Terriglobales bacterium]
MKRAAAVLLPLVVLLAACSKEPDVKIDVVMKKYTITPAEIRVKKGQRVQLTVSTADVQHGFAVPDLGIKEPVQKGKPAVIVFEARRAGTYPVTCSIICGAGHEDMQAKIIVE